MDCRKSNFIIKGWEKQRKDTPRYLNFFLAGAWENSMKLLYRRELVHWIGCSGLINLRGHVLCKRAVHNEEEPKKVENSNNESKDGENKGDEHVCSENAEEMAEVSNAVIDKSLVSSELYFAD